MMDSALQLFWESESILPDFSWIRGAVMGFFIAILGLLASKYIPGILLKLIIGGGFIALGVALLLGWIDSDIITNLFQVTTTGGI